MALQIMELGHTFSKNFWFA